MSGSLTPILKSITQLSMVVRDLEETVQNYVELGMGPWVVFDFNPTTVTEMMAYGKSIDHRFRLALYAGAGVELELIEPLDGLSIFGKFLLESGEGLHHIGYSTDYRRATRLIAENGIQDVESGKWYGRGIYRFLDTVIDLGHIAEIDNSSEETDFVQSRPAESGVTEITFPPPREYRPGRTDWASLSSPLLQRVVRVSIVVRDIEKTIVTNAERYGLQHWEVFEITPSTMSDMRVRGNLRDFAYRSARHWAGSGEIELIQPLDEHSVFAEFLDERGGGIHHITYEVADLDRSVRSLAGAGISEIQSGRWYGQTPELLLDAHGRLKHVIGLEDPMSRSSLVQTEIDNTGNRTYLHPVPNHVYS